MRKIVALGIIAVLLLSLCACSSDSRLDPDEPVTLTMWHVYGEQADSPMNRLITEFNGTVGKERGIIVNVTKMTNARDIGGLLTEALEDKPGAPEMPDLFTCHAVNAAALGTGNVLDWKQWFTEDELATFVDSFVTDGMVGDTLAVLPVSKSTNLLFVNGSQFARFSADTGVSLDDLATWDGFFAAAEAYYHWSGGKPMCALDYLLTAVELDAQAKGGVDFETESGWYDLDNAELKASYYEFMRPLIQGHIAVSDLYSNTQVMTGETMSGLGSSAAILYYNDTVTYPDNTTEPTNLTLLPYPQAANGKHLMTQAGVGLAAYRTTPEKAEAASVFAHWLTESERNLDFVAQTGYMPVRSDAFEKIDTYSFAAPEYAALYRTLDTMRADCTAVSDTSAADHYTRVYRLYDRLREYQVTWQQRLKDGADIETLLEEAWALFCAQA